MQEEFNDYIASGINNQNLIAEQKRTFMKNYERFFPQDKKSFVLDIGIGRGEMLWCMKERGFDNYLGIDISPSVVEYCRKAGYNCELVEDAVGFLNKNPNRFSVITMLDVLEHIELEKVVGFLSAIKTALAPGGKFIVQTPNMQAPYGYMTRYHDITHKFGVDERSLGQLLVSAGFHDYKCYSYEDIIADSPLAICRRAARGPYRFTVRVLRYINGMLNSKILSSRIYAVAKKENADQ